MKKLFLTTALIFPLAIAPALAQPAAVPPPVPEATQDAVTDPAADTTTGTDAPGKAMEATDDPAVEAASNAADAAGDAADAAADAAAEAEAAASDAAAVVTDPDKVVQQQAANELRLDWVTGATVTSPDGETIGSVSDLILDRDSGRMVAAVIGVGGFLGIGEKKIAVPWDRLMIDYDANQITSDLSRAEAEAAPEYIFREREALPPAAVDAGVPAAVPAPVQ